MTSVVDAFTQADGDLLGWSAAEFSPLTVISNAVQTTSIAVTRGGVRPETFLAYKQTIQVDFTIDANINNIRVIFNREPAGANYLAVRVLANGVSLIPCVGGILQTAITGPSFTALSLGTHNLKVEFDSYFVRVTVDGSLVWSAPRSVGWTYSPTGYHVGLWMHNPGVSPSWSFDNFSANDTSIIPSGFIWMTDNWFYLDVK
jgi:hypothetical protein